ncbi:DUF222 domain-containing protein [Cellulomonas sp. PhB150]|uniref:HNH endonuclease n=1 Tax=Cellulomonas sp. PhB150 TaxID=2485188 RepID=UPI000FBB9BC7|nr:DUF222 domain-containing protein [Cellulomonas sp. PhB150]ROS30575.1 HNH endonuclease [Cellulomonas sp. PhB150]
MTIAPVDPAARADARGVACLSADRVAAFREQVAAVLGTGSSPEDVSLIAALEELKSTVCAAQAALSVALDTAERDRQAVAGVPARRRGQGVAAQVGLARRESPHRGSVLLGAAKVWTAEMPHTFAALRAGRLSEYRAMILVAETACLEREDRAEVDRLLCAGPASLDGVGTRALAALARGHAARLDPSAVVRRARRAEGERRVSIRPAPDTMCYLSALVPMKHGIAAFAALKTAADLARTTGGGDPRGHGQIMADTLIQRITGLADPDDIPVTVNLVLSDTTLLGAGHDPAHLQTPGTGPAPVPAQIARELIAAGLDTHATWLRRLYADPHRQLVAMSTKQRFHPDGLATFLRLRDQGICRTPYCGAPIRHIDHITPAADGGVTDATNSQGLCEACNHTKQAPGWTQTLTPDTHQHTVITTTPTGHRYASHAPPPPTPAPPPHEPETYQPAIDLAFERLLAKHAPVEYQRRAA